MAVIVIYLYMFFSLYFCSENLFSVYVSILVNTYAGVYADTYASDDSHILLHLLTINAL